MTDLSEYERKTRKFFWLGPIGFLTWLAFHRASLTKLFADPRMTDGSKQAARETL